MDINKSRAVPPFVGQLKWTQQSVIRETHVYFSGYTEVSEWTSNALALIQIFLYEI